MNLVANFERAVDRLTPALFLALGMTSAVALALVGV